MKNHRLIAAVLVLSAPVAVFLQSTLLANSLPGGSTPNLGFMLTVVAGFLWGGAAGAVAGLWTGAWLGAAAGSLAAPVACLYGCLGMLAGIHSERLPRAWTYPLVTTCLAVMLTCGDSWVSLAIDGYQPPLSWKLQSVAWCSLFGLPLIAMGRGQREEA